MGTIFHTEPLSLPSSPVQTSPTYHPGQAIFSPLHHKQIGLLHLCLATDCISLLILQRLNILSSPLWHFQLALSTLSLRCRSHTPFLLLFFLCVPLLLNCIDLWRLNITSFFYWHLGTLRHTPSHSNICKCTKLKKSIVLTKVVRYTTPRNLLFLSK